MDRALANRVRKIALLGRLIMKRLGKDNYLLIEYEKVMISSLEIRVKIAHKKGLNVQQNVQQNFANLDNNFMTEFNVYKNATKLT